MDKSDNSYCWNRQRQLKYWKPFEVWRQLFWSFHPKDFITTATASLMAASFIFVKSMGLLSCRKRMFVVPFCAWTSPPIANKARIKKFLIHVLIFYWFWILYMVILGSDEFRFFSVSTVMLSRLNSWCQFQSSRARLSSMLAGQLSAMVWRKSGWYEMVNSGMCFWISEAISFLA